MGDYFFTAVYYPHCFYLHKVNVVVVTVFGGGHPGFLVGAGTAVHDEFTGHFLSKKSG